MAKSYHNYKSSLDQAVTDFKKEMRHETESLIMVDDILGEMAMIKRVYQDQNRILSLMANLSNKLNRNPDVRDEGPLTFSSETVQKDQKDDDFNETRRSASSRQMTARLRLLEEEAQRTRESVSCPVSIPETFLWALTNGHNLKIRTLLDLRQRQVNIQMAIDAKAQSDVASAQSEIVFVFTLYTVIFVSEIYGRGNGLQVKVKLVIRLMRRLQPGTPFLGHEPSCA